MARRRNNTVFSDVTGVASMQDDKPVRLIIPKFNDGKLMITKITGGVRPNFQLMYSLGADVFINAFNQRLSIWTLNGIHIPSACANGDNGIRRIGEEDKAHKGEPAFVDLYRRFNIRTAPVPLDMAFNGIVLVGFFIELKILDYTQEGVDGFAWEVSFLGRMNNLLEEQDPIEVEDVAAEDVAAAEKVREGELAWDEEAYSPPPVGDGPITWHDLSDELETALAIPGIEPTLEDFPIHAAAESYVYTAPPIPDEDLEGAQFTYMTPSDRIPLYDIQSSEKERLNLLQRILDEEADRYAEESARRAGY